MPLFHEQLNIEMKPVDMREFRNLVPVSYRGRDYRPKVTAGFTIGRLSFFGMVRVNRRSRSPEWVQEIARHTPMMIFTFPAAYLSGMVVAIVANLAI